MISDVNINCGDSRNLLRELPDASVDLILTDPPYNIGKFSTGNIKLPWRRELNNDVAVWDKVEFRPEEWEGEFRRLLKPDGNLFVFTSYNLLGRWHACLDKHFDTTQIFVWHKTNPPPKIYKAGFLNSCELVFCCWNKGHVWNFSSQSTMHNFIESPICMGGERIENPRHPTQKPLKVLSRLIEIASNIDGIVLDPFMGVGSTGVAAINLHRRFIGFELDEEYFVAARKRLSTREFK